MDIVDALVVTLTLDTSGYDRGHQKARDDIEKTKASAEGLAGSLAQSAERMASAQAAQADALGKLAAGVEEKRKRQDEADARRASESVKRQKEVEEQAKRLGQGLSRVAQVATGAFTSLTMGSGVMAFARQVEQANANTELLAKNLGVSSSKLDYVSKAMQAAGGSAQDAQSALGLVANTFQAMANFQTPANAGWLAKLGVDPASFRDADKGLDELGRKLRDWQARNGRQGALFLGRQIGLSDGALNYMLSDDKDRAGFDDAARKAAATPADTKTAREFESSLSKLTSSLGKAASDIEAGILPPLTKAIDWFRSKVEWLNEPGHEVQRDVAIGGAGLAGLYGAKKLGDAAGGIMRWFLGAGAKVVESEAAEKVGEEAGISLLGRVAGALGSTAKFLGGKATGIIGGLVLDSNPTAANDDFGWAERHRRYLEAHPPPDPAKEWWKAHAPAWLGGSDAPSPATGTDGGLVHPSAYHPGVDDGGDLSNRVDTFWNRFGDGLIEWLERQSTANSYGITPGGANVLKASYTVGGPEASPSAFPRLPDVVTPSFGGGTAPDVSRLMGDPRFSEPEKEGGADPRNSGAMRDMLRSLSPAGSAPVAGGGKEATLSALEAQNGLPHGVLDAIWSIESGRGANPGRSSAGARGDFQFMPGTAKAWNVNPLDFASSAGGAARYMAYLLKMFRGDSDKAIAAYNWGEGNVGKAASRWGGDWQSHAPRETQNYLAKAHAAMSSRYAGPSGGGQGGGSNSLSIGQVTIHTQATDAKGISKDLQAEIGQRFPWMHRVDTGLS